MRLCVALCGLLFVAAWSGVQAANWGCDGNWNLGRNRCYRQYPSANKMTWAEAEEFCAQRDAIMVQILDEAENEWVWGLALGVDLDVEDRWIGLTNQGQGEVWHDGRPNAFTHLPQPLAPGQCAYMGGDKNWYPANCDEKKHVICKKCPQNYQMQNGECYRFYEPDFGRDFWDAFSICSGQGGKLVKVENEQENDFLGAALGGDVNEFWLGAHDKTDSEDFVWWDGEIPVNPASADVVGGSTGTDWTNWGAGMTQATALVNCMVMTTGNVWKSTQCHSSVVEVKKPFWCKLNDELELSMTPWEPDHVHYCPPAVPSPSPPTIPVEVCACTVRGDPLFAMFDNLWCAVPHSIADEWITMTKYKFPSEDACSFAASVRICALTDQAGEVIPDETYPCALRLQFNGNTIEMTGSGLYVNNAQVPDAELQDKKVFNEAQFTVKVDDMGTLVFYTFNCGVVGSFNPDDATSAARVRIPQEWGADVWGACGNCNEEPDDFTAADGTDMSGSENACADTVSSFVEVTAEVLPVDTVA